MRLYISSASPFVRKIRIVLREKGLADQVVEKIVNPIENDPGLVAAHPLAQIPALELDNGQVLSDSLLIAHYFEEASTGTKLLPPMSDDSYWTVRHQEVTANQILEAAVKLVLEGRRPEAERSSSWLARWTQGLERGLAVAETQIEAADLAGRLTLGSLSLVVAHTYLKFRFPNLMPAGAYPRLEALCEVLEQRDSFKATSPFVS